MTRKSVRQKGGGVSLKVRKSVLLEAKNGKNGDVIEEGIEHTPKKRLRNATINVGIGVRVCACVSVSECV